MATMLAIAGCSGPMIQGKKIDYKSAPSAKPLNVPADLSVPPTSDRYDLPDSGAGSATASEYSEGQTSKPGSGPAPVLPPQDKVRVERAGSQRWLVVDAEADALWPTIKEFWQDSGFLIDIESRETGIMVTDWAENRAKIPDGAIRRLLGKIIDSAYSYPERDKFRTRLERGADGDVTEIYISHRGMEQVLVSKSSRTETTMWQAKPVDPELEAEMLVRLAARLGARDEQIRTQLSEPEPPKATISTSSGRAESLLLDESFDRAWRRVGLALDRVGFTVEDRDRSNGLYFVRYVDVDAPDHGKSKGFWSRLAFWRSDKDSKQDQYRIRVADVEKGTEVRVLDGQNAKSKSPTAERILALLQRELK